MRVYCYSEDNYYNDFNTWFASKVPGFDRLVICMYGRKKKEGKECSQLYPAVNRELSDEMENLLSST